MLIQNYGLFWKQEKVIRGAPGPGGAGVLMGKLATDAGFVVDFRQQQAVYVLYDSNFRVVYVGQTGRGQNQRLLNRWNAHMRDHLEERWERFSWFGFRWVTAGGNLAVENLNLGTTTSDALNHLEATLIAASEPPLNRQGGSFGDAQLYLHHTEVEA